MNGFYFQLLALFVILLPLSIFVAALIKCAYSPTINNSWINTVPKKIIRFCGLSTNEMSWEVYAKALMITNLAGIVFVYCIQIFQEYLPLNPQGFSNVASYLALNTSVSFVSNTNWQAYSGESSLSYLTQMLALTSQNFLSAATGISVLFALMRGLTRKESSSIGNFYSDLVNSIWYCLLPLSFIVAIFLCYTGVPQTFSEYPSVQSIENVSEILPVGPVASQVAIKQLGTNGGGYYGINSAHPLENPSPLSNLLELLSILLIPAASYLAYGSIIKNRKEGYMLYGTMTVLFIVFASICYHFESGVLNNLEGKEVRHGVVGTTIWAVATSLTSSGSINGAHDSLSPIAGAVPMVAMQLGEVVFGGVGSGFYGLISFIIATVFISGLLVGRTPEYLGKKIGSFEMQMSAVCMLLPCMLVLVGTAIGGKFGDIAGTVLNKGPHGFSELLYAYTSMGNNNGSAFGGFPAALQLHLVLGSCIMFGSRFLPIIATLAMAGSFAKKKVVPKSAGTLPTDTITFMVLLVTVIFLLGALSFFPAIALGPIADFLTVF